MVVSIMLRVDKHYRMQVIGLWERELRATRGKKGECAIDRVKHVVEKQVKILAASLS